MKTIECIQCNANFQGYSGRKFCTKSCAATYNNTIAPKRKTTPLLCKGCRCIIGTAGMRKSFCEQCFISYKFKKSEYKFPIEYRTIAQQLNSTAVTSRSNLRGAIRFHASKTILSTNQPKVCNNCRYDKHVEVCHIKGISTFPEDTLISEVNSLNNLIYLCPNCHWELDHGMLRLNVNGGGDGD